MGGGRTIEINVFLCYNHRKGRNKQKGAGIWQVLSWKK